MDIQKFFELSAGKWFSQRTSYQLLLTETENSKSEITIDLLSPDDTALKELCQQANLEAGTDSIGLKYNWDTSVDWGNKAHKGSTILVAIANPNNPQEGQLLRKLSDSVQSENTGRYRIGNDEAVTLMIEENGAYIEERIWFASENLRMRTSVVKRDGKCYLTSFYSEIRRLSPQPESTEKSTANQA
ncbi:MAG: phycobiliprotein lyase [Chroococcales cyanobacterium]